MRDTTATPIMQLSHATLAPKRKHANRRRKVSERNHFQGEVIKKPWRFQSGNVVLQSSTTTTNEDCLRRRYCAVGALRGLPTTKYENTYYGGQWPQFMPEGY